MEKIFKTLENIKGMEAKSNVISPLLWIYFSTFVGTISYISFATQPNNMVIIWLLVFLSGLLLTVIATFLVLIIKTPDFLRSEMYALRKLLIEKGTLGDSNLPDGDLSSSDSEIHQDGENE